MQADLRGRGLILTKTPGGILTSEAEGNRTFDQTAREGIVKQPLPKALFLGARGGSQPPILTVDLRLHRAARIRVRRVGLCHRLLVNQAR
jgi:hypothetical protein